MVICATRLRAFGSTRSGLLAGCGRLESQDYPGLRLVAFI